MCEKSTDVTDARTSVTGLPSTFLLTDARTSVSTLEGQSDPYHQPLRLRVIWKP